MLYAIMFKDSGDNVFLLIQALGLLAFLCTTLSYWGKSKKRILAIQIVGDIFYAIHYFLLGALTGGLTQVLGLFRETSFFCAKTMKQEKIIFFVLVPIYLFIGCMTSNTIVEIFPIIASITYCYTLTMAAKYVVLGGLIDAIYWLFYDIICGSYTGALADGIVIISNIFSLIHRKKETNYYRK